MLANGAQREAALALAAQIDEEDGEAFRLARDLRQRRGAREQQHQVGVLHARDPDLLAVDDVAVAAALGERLDFGGVRAGGGLGDGERLQAQFAGRDCRQVAPLLFLGAVAQQRAHDVHLRVAGAGIGAGAIDLFEDDGGFRDAKAAAAVLCGNQRGEPSGVGERLDEFFRVAGSRFDALPILAVELRRTARGWHGGIRHDRPRAG